MDSRCFFILFVIVLSLYFVQPSGIGKCPKHEYMKNFNISRFTGHWYEVERSFYLMELASTCVNLNLEENSKKQIEVVVNTIGRWSGSHKETKGIATTSKKDNSIFLFRVNSRLPNSLARLLPGAGFYQVLNTDYDNFAILWTCSSALLAHTDLIWILGRRREIDVLLRAQIYDFLSKRRIDSERLILTRNNCTFEEKI